MVCLVTFFLHRMNFSEISLAFIEFTKTLIGAGFVLLFTVPLVRTMINSGINSNDMISMPIAMAERMTNLLGNIYLYLLLQSEQ